MAYRLNRKLHEVGETPVIRGAVIVVNIALYVGPTVKRAISLDKSEFPVQTNNLTAWFRAAAKRMGKDLSDMMKATLENLHLIVNDGLGAKRGRGCNDNTFELQLHDSEGFIQQRLHFTVVTEAHVTRYIHRKAIGAPLQKRTDWSKVTHHWPKENIVLVYDEVNGVQQTWDAEEYFEKWPYRRGQLKVRT